VARRVERSENDAYHRGATALTLLSFEAELIRREQPYSSYAGAPGTDTCPGGTAAIDAQWGDRAFERQYRDRMGLRWLVCVRVHESTGGV
jgi:hypothetical protein